MTVRIEVPGLVLWQLNMSRGTKTYVSTPEGTVELDPSKVAMPLWLYRLLTDEKVAEVELAELFRHGRQLEKGPRVTQEARSRVPA